MAEVSEGFEGQNGKMGETGWDVLFGTMMHSGVIPSASTALQVFSDQDGARVKVRPGQALIRGSRYILTGENLNRQITTNSSATLARRDLVCVRKDLSGDQCRIVVTPGTPAASPVLPSPTRVASGSSFWDEPLADVLVPANFGRSGGPGSIAPANITDIRTCAWPIDAVGEAHWRPGVTAPAPFGWARYDGTLYRSDRYPRLATACSTYYNGGSVAANSFRVPDARGSHLRHADTSADLNSASASKIGSDTASLSDPSMNAAHVHGPGAGGDPGASGRFVYETGSPESHYIPANGAPTAGVNNAQVSFTDIYPSGAGAPFSVRPKAVLGYFWVRLC